MRLLLIVVITFAVSGIFAQRPIYDYRVYEKTLEVPKLINSGRSAVIVTIPDKKDEFIRVGEYQKLSNQAHKAFVTMGIDAILYLNHHDFTASNNTRETYTELLNRRQVKTIIFLTQAENSYELLIAPFSGDEGLIKNEDKVFFMKDKQVYDLLLAVGKEVRRAGFELENFLIPEKPNYLSGLSIVENTLLKNYPGILRRSKLAVERFAPLTVPKVSDSSAIGTVIAYNETVERKNEELEAIMQAYPYEFELIDPMSDDELKRNRYQFLLRSIEGPCRSVRQMLGYEVKQSETAFASVIPIMPDQTKVKTIPQDALVYKFYVRQNITKNIHVGEWDADTSWQSALRNMIGNLIQEFNVE